MKCLPYQIIPGIFSSIDSYVKKLVHDHFDRRGRAPQWLAPLEVVGYMATPTWRHFNYTFERYGIRVGGTPDEMLLRHDEKLVIPDYKTARCTETQDGLFPEYEVQLNSYALIAEKQGYPEVAEIPLVYLEPRTECGEYCEFYRDGGFQMAFDAKIVRIEHRPALLEPLLERARSIYEMTEPPQGRLGCKNGDGLDGLFGALICPVD